MKVVCFRCKEEGHWARDCVAGHTDTLMPGGIFDGDNGEDEGDFPSLEQAAEMARETIQWQQIHAVLLSFGQFLDQGSKLFQPLTQFSISLLVNYANFGFSLV